MAWLDVDELRILSIFLHPQHQRVDFSWRLLLHAIQEYHQQLTQQ